MHQEEHCLSSQLNWGPSYYFNYFILTKISDLVGFGNRLDMFSKILLLNTVIFDNIKQ